jgi:hypothetical protein
MIYSKRIVYFSIFLIKALMIVCPNSVAAWGPSAVMILPSTSTALPV